MANIRVAAELSSQIISGVNPALEIFYPPSPDAGIEGLYPSVNTSKSFIFPAVLSTRVMAGIKANSFKDDFYYKIRYIPSILNLGTVTADQQVDLYVFNGFFVDQTLNTLTLGNGDGLQISGPSTPANYNPLELSLYQISVSIDGPSTVDATITFDWADPIDNNILSIVGTRSITIPYLFQPNNTREILNWKTQVIISNNGSEQRIGVRQSPRQSFQVVINPPSYENSILDNFLYAWRGNIFAIPVTTDCKFSTGPTATDSPNIPVETEFANFQEGNLAMIFQSERVYELVEIQTVNASSIIATRDLGSVFPSGSLVVPVINAIVTQNPNRIFNGYKSSLSTTFQSMSNNLLSSSPSATQYKSNDVLLDEIFLDSDTSSETYVRNTEVIDYESGLIDVFNTWTNTKPRRNFRVDLNSLEDVWNFKLWLHRRAGRLRPFWIPTYEDNFRLTNTSGNVGVTFNVIDDGQLTLTGNRIDIAISTTSGWFLREITDIAQAGSNLAITIDSAINVDASEIEFISYFDLKRLDSDQIEIEWIGNFNATCVIPVINVN